MFEGLPHLLCAYEERWEHLHHVCLPTQVSTYSGRQQLLFPSLCQQPLLILTRDLEAECLGSDPNFTNVHSLICQTYLIWL